MAGFIKTQTTRDMEEGRKNVRVDMSNRKPFRTRSQKLEARKSAELCKDGVYRSAARVSYHKPIPVGK